MYSFILNFNYDLARMKAFYKDYLITLIELFKNLLC